MTYNQALKLHNEDEVTVKETGEVLFVIQSYSPDNTKRVFIECDDGNTYLHTEIK